MAMTSRRAWGIGLVAASWAAVPALAHTGHGPGGLAGGFGHPFGGWDHVLAMVAVGLWASQLGGRALWLLPASFVGAMVLGFGSGWAASWMEGAILASVVALGLLLAAPWRFAAGAAALVVAAFGWVHGMAHGVEMPAAGSSWLFAAGFGTGTAVLHAGGLAAGLLAGRLMGAPAFRLAGAVVVAGGVAAAILG